MTIRPRGYPYHTLIETYRSWGQDPGLAACLSGRRPGGLASIVRLVLLLKKIPLYDLLGDYPLGLRAGQQALEEADAGGLAVGRAQALLSLCWMYCGTSEFQRMKESARKALEVFSAHGNAQGQAQAQEQLGDVHLELGDWEKSQAHYEQALELYQGLGDRLGEAACLVRLSGFFCNNGYYEKALPLAERALRLSQETGNLDRQAQCWDMLGTIQRDLGNTAKAQEFDQQMYGLYQTIGSRSGQAAALHNIAFNDASLGNYARAIPSFEEACALEASVGNRSGLAFVLSNLGKTYEDLGDFEQSVAYQEKALALWRELGQRRALTYGLVLLVYAALGKGGLAGARRALEEAQALIQIFPQDNDLQCHFFQGAAALALEEDDLSKAALELETGLLLAEAQGYKIYQAFLLFLRARLREKQGEWPGAQTDYEDSAKLYSTLGEKAKLARTCTYYGLTLLAHKEEDKGRWYLSEARKIWEAIGAKGWLERMN